MSSSVSARQPKPPFALRLSRARGAAFRYGLSLAVVLATGCAPRVMAWQTPNFNCPPAPPPPTGDRITAQFMGTTSILFRDEHTAILSDGFVTRPSAAQLARGVVSSDAHVTEAIRCLGVTDVAAVFVGHTHHDHALDAPRFALKTRAKLLGSASVQNILLDVNLPDDRIDVVKSGDPHTFGRFTVTFVESAHSRPNTASGPIEEPLRMPARRRDWKSGETWSTFISHGTRTILVHGSANYEFAALRGRHADVVYLGVGSLGDKSDDFVDAYWDEVVVRTGAKRVFLVHWDNFFSGLDKPIERMPRVLDRVDDAIRRLEERGARDHVRVRLATLWEAVDPFEGL